MEPNGNHPEVHDPFICHPDHVLQQVLDALIEEKKATAHELAKKTDMLPVTAARVLRELRLLGLIYISRGVWTPYQTKSKPETDESPIAEEVLAYITKTPNCSTRTIAMAIGRSRDAVTRAIKVLEHAKKTRLVGVGHRAGWFVSDDVKAPL